MNHSDDKAVKDSFESELPEIKVTKLDDEAVLLQCKTY